MVTKRLLIVFVLPVLSSIIFGSAVLLGIAGSDGALNSQNTSPSVSQAGIGNANIQIIGLSSQYSTSQPVSVQVKVTDPAFNCGDLYITIYVSGSSETITQGAYFEQCFNSQNNLMPIGIPFSRIIDTPGSYDLVTKMISKPLPNISIKGTFTVK